MNLKIVNIECDPYRFAPAVGKYCNKDTLWEHLEDGRWRMVERTFLNGATITHSCKEYKQAIRAQSEDRPTTLMWPKPAGSYDKKNTVPKENKAIEIIRKINLDLE